VTNVCYLVVDNSCPTSQKKRSFTFQLIHFRIKKRSVSEEPIRDMQKSVNISKTYKAALILQKKNLADPKLLKSSN